MVFNGCERYHARAWMHGQRSRLLLAIGGVILLVRFLRVMLIMGGSCKTFFDGRVERVDRVDLDAEMFQLAHGAD